jgi:aspartokinase-like uncharacterized kinase
MTLTVVKIGGSLYDLPELGLTLRRWLATLAASKVLLVPGGGPSADVIRTFDRVHALGEKIAHDLALRSLTLNAWFLAELFGVPVVDPCSSGWQGIALLDAHAFNRNAAVQQKLPACWDATSDSVAAVAAIVLHASELVLLKSTEEAEGLVDPLFSRLVEGEGFNVRIVNLRRWPGEPGAKAPGH